MLRTAITIAGVLAGRVVEHLDVIDPQVLVVPHETPEYFEGIGFLYGVMIENLRINALRLQPGQKDQVSPGDLTQ